MAADILATLQGYRVRRTRRGFVVIECDYDAIPRPPGWAQEREATLGPRRWKREYLRNRSIGGEHSFFSGFSTEAHVRRIHGLLPLPVYRGFDFGRRHPACVWLQYSPLSNRVWFLREIVLDDVDVYTFRDLVLYLSGQLSRGALERRPRALSYLSWLENEVDAEGQPMPKTPWFHPLEASFVDYAGHEATIDRSGIVETESEEKTYADVFRAGGIDLSHHYYRVSARITLMRQLLSTRGDGQPGAFFDPACPLLIKAMGGALAYKKGTKLNPKPEEPAKIPIFGDVFDAASYPLPNLVEVDEDGSFVNLAKTAPGQGRDVDRRRAPEADGDGEGFDTGILDVWR